MSKIIMRKAKRAPPVDKYVSPELSEKRRQAAILGNARRWAKKETPPPASGPGDGEVSQNIQAIEVVTTVCDEANNGAASAPVEVSQAVAMMPEICDSQFANPGIMSNQYVTRSRVEAGAQSVAIVRRLCSIARGRVSNAGITQQIAAGKLVLEVAGVLGQSAPPVADSSTPLTQQDIGALRAVIAQGESEVRRLQAELDALAVPGEVLQDGEDGDRALDG